MPKAFIMTLKKGEETFEARSGVYRQLGALGNRWALSGGPLPKKMVVSEWVMLLDDSFAGVIRVWMK